MPQSLSPPIFVIGSPRSGTTLLRLMLTCHEGIVVPPECGFAQWLKARFDRWQPECLVEFCDAVSRSRKFETWGIEEERLRRFLESRAPATYSDAVSAVYECYGEVMGRRFRRWGDKNNYYLHHIPILAEMFPSAFFIHLVRDGRDVTCSYREVVAGQWTSPYAPKLHTDVAEIAVEWSGNLREIRQSLGNLDAARSCELRYEDLVREPEPVLRRLCNALGEPYDPDMLEYHRINAQRRLEPGEFMGWKAKTAGPPSTSGIERYRRDLSRSDVAAFERLAHDMLVEYGYMPEGQGAGR
jgi:hypothetical protein